MADAESRTVRWARRLWWRESLLLLPTLGWLLHDRTPWSWDPAWYGEVATDLWWTLVHQPAQWGGQMLGAFGIKAPALAWFAQFFVPLGQEFGAVDDTLMLVPAFAGLLTIRLWFSLGTSLWSGDSRGGWLLALLGAGAPLFVGLTHQFFVEPLQLLGVTWLWWLAMLAPQLPRLRLALLGSLAGVFLVATKVTSPAFGFLPVLLILWQLGTSPQPWLGPSRRAHAGDALLAAGLLLFGVATMGWYARNFTALREWVVFAAQDESSLIYGRRPDFLVKWGFWLPAVHREFFNVLVGFGLLPLTLWLAFRARGDLGPDGGRRLLAGAGVLQVLVVLWGFSRQIPEITRYSLPLLTSALLPILWVLKSAAARPAIVAGCLALAAAQWVWSHATPLDLLPAAPRGSEWLVRADPEPASGAELDALIARTTTPATAFRYFINGYELPWLNANTLSYHAAKGRLSTGIRAYYTSLGYGAHDAEAAWRRMEEMQAEGFISLAPTAHAATPSFMNQVARPVLDRVATGPEFVPETFTNSHDIVLYRRAPKLH